MTSEVAAFLVIGWVWLVSHYLLTFLPTEEKWEWIMQPLVRVYLATGAVSLMIAPFIFINNL